MLLPWVCLGLNKALTLIFHGHCRLFGPSVKVLRGGEAALDSLVLRESSFAFLGRSGGTVTDCLRLPEIQPDGSGVGWIDGGQPGCGQLLDLRTQPLSLRNHAWSGIHPVPHVFHLLYRSHAASLCPVGSITSMVHRCSCCPLIAR
jgi:hypothetical protein